MKKPNLKQRYPLLDIILTSVTILLVFSCSYLFFVFKNESTSAMSKFTGAKDLIPSTIDEVDSNFAGIKIVTEISNDSNAPFAIQYPQSQHIQFNDIVKKYIKGIKYNYLTEIAANKQHNNDLTSELNISFETFEHNGIYSFVIVKNEVVGENEGEIEIQTFRLNPDTGERMTIEEAFTNQQDALPTISQLTLAYLQQDESLKSHLLPAETEKHTEAIWENFQNFALTEDAIVFYFTQNTMAHRDAGVPIATIPYKSINELLADTVRATTLNDLAEKQKPSSPSNEKANEKDGANDVNKQELEVDKGIPQQKRVALTFDDGPDPKVTTRILETLEKYDAKATFFMLGSRVEYYPEIARSVYEAGHELGNHSWTHPDLTKAQTDKVTNEINRTNEIIEDVTGQKPEIFRPPYGAFNDNVLNITDLSMILWDVDTLDWKHRNANELLTYVKQQTRDGSIILMHDIHPSTADGLNAVLAFLSENDYEFVTISELNE